MVPLLLLAACTELTTSVTIDSEMSTLARVSASSPTPSRAWVEYGEDTGYGKITPMSAVGTLHEIPIVGLKPDTTWHYRVIYSLAGELVASEDATFDTGPLPTWIPAHEVTGGPVDDYTVLSWWSVNDMDGVAMIADPDGEIVWYQRANQLAQSVRLSTDGTALVYLDVGIGRDALAELVRAPLDGSPSTRVSVPFAHHDFIERSDGSFGYLSSELRQVDGVDVLGDSVWTWSAGQSTEVWNAFESLEIVENAGFGQRPIDWTHANGLAWRDADRTWVVSLYWDQKLLSFDEQGAQRWTFGGTGSDWRLTEDAFAGPQHSPRWRSNDLTIFDNANDRECSRLAQYTFDPNVGRAALVWSWEPEDALSVRLMGDVQRLNDGSAVSAWAEAEQVRWIRADNTEWMRITFDGDGLVGKVDHTRSLWGPDAELPWITLPI